MNIDGKTIIHGIIGNPVAHSLSPAMHNGAFAACGMNRIYVPFTVENPESALIGLKALNIGGVSVTIPHKTRVLEFLDEIDPVAEKIGAVNTIAVMGEGAGKRLFGTNTDWIGANRALSEHLQLAGSRVALLGAGGAARAIGFGLLEAGASLHLFSRTESKGRALARMLDCPWHSLASGLPVDYDAVVNATSVGMTPQTESSPLDASMPARCRVVMDIVYSPLETRLLRDAGKAGCICINGLEMLLYQGAAQFELWTGSGAPIDIMRRVLVESVTSSDIRTADKR